MRRSSSDDEDGGLDSLLDTMTNVVGILVIVLVVTQLGVGDAVQRITSETEIDPEKMKADLEELEALTKERDQLLAAMDDQQPIDSSQVDQELETLRQELAAQQELVDRLRQQNQQQEDSLAKQKARAAELTSESEKDKKQHEELTGELQTALESLDRLKAVLDDTPVRTAPPPKEITLPDPRPAPEGADRLTFLCSQNKVYPIPVSKDHEPIRKLAQQIAAGVIQSKRLEYRQVPGESPQLYVLDTERFVTEFNKVAPRTFASSPLTKAYTQYYDITLAAAGSYPRLRFEPRESAGETERIVVGNNSRFQRALRAINPQSYYLKFIVCTDSFDIYVTTRAITTKLGLLAGWEPQGENWIFQTHLGGPLRLGEPKPPEPEPKPPTPPQPEKPKPPPRPSNVID